ncbi:MAG: hypothetical protein MMC33_005183 [Icmadophila ericetorum]|nr:hypothetical protein [Icmadophila ericetorum]
MDLKSRVDILEHDLSSKEDELRKLKGAMKAQEIQFSRLKDRVVRLTVDGAHGKEAFENNQTHGLQTHLTNTVVQDLLPSIYVDMSLLSIGGAFPPKLPNYHGEEDKWVDWRRMLEVELDPRANQFSSEHDKMQFIRTHCRDSAFDLIAADTLLGERPSRYLHDKALISQLEYTFGPGKLNRSPNTQAWLSDQYFNFGQNFGTFTRFLAQFTENVEHLGLTQKQKEKQLRLKLSWHIYRVRPSTVGADYRELVEFCYALDQESSGSGVMMPILSSERAWKPTDRTY